MKCAHHENGQGGPDGGAGEDSREEKENKFRHHPIYKLSLGQVNTSVASIDIDQSISIYQTTPTR